MDILSLKAIADVSISVAVIYMLFRLLNQTIPTKAVLSSLADAINRQVAAQEKFSDRLIEIILTREEKEKDNASNPFE